MNFNYSHCQIKDHAIKASVILLSDYKNYLLSLRNEQKYEVPQSSIRLPFDEENISSVIELKEKLVSTALKYVVVVGIGGSNLGAKAVYDALFGYGDIFEEDRHPKIVFLETLNAAYTKKALKKLSHEIKHEDEIIAVIITKSGTTAETLVNYEILEEAIPLVKQRTVYIANEDAPLTFLARKRGLPHLVIQKPVSGRFSIFSPAGLFPLACAGIDVIDLLEGGMSAIEDHLVSDSIAISANSILAHYRNGKIINENFFFDSRLESMGKWQRQLTAESLGKESIFGAREGINPSFSIGTTDLHSMFQLFLGGPQVRFFNLVNIAHLERNSFSKANITNTKINSHSDTELLKDIYRNFKNTFTEKGIPFTELVLDSVSEKELGAYMQFKMIETMFLGKLLQVNAFDQPNVESYKKQTHDHI